jgi:hypothetical protein
MVFAILIKLITITEVGQVARMGKKRDGCRASLKEINRLEYLSEMIMLKYMSRMKRGA